MTTELKNLRVCNTLSPLAVEDPTPVFSWAMSSDQKGQKQTAYQILVKNEVTQETLWNTGKIESARSTDISYEGTALEAESAYSFELTVWDKDGQTCTSASRFETGLMNPKQEAWDGAEFIGTKSVVLDAASACAWHMNTDMQILEGGTASLIVGANDFRLNDKFQNVENIAGENYIRIEFDLSGVKTGEGAKLNIYRIGYAQGDTDEKPYRTISAKDNDAVNIDELFTPENADAVHNIDIFCETGNITIHVDGQELYIGPEELVWGRMKVRPAITVSTMPAGNNFNTFPNLNSIGFASRKGAKARFSNYKILDVGQSAKEVLFDRTTGATYRIFEGMKGVQLTENGIEVSGEAFGYADPSFGSMPMLRTEFTVSKPLKSAKMYVTAMGIYEMYINGARMGEDWFNPADSQYRDTLCYHAYDVTAMLSEGENAVGALLGGGWYVGYMTFTPGNYNFFGDHPALLAKLVLTYEDGTKETIVTNPSTWQVYQNGPIEYSSFFQGERYNAAKANAVADWTKAGYDASAWETCEVIEVRDWIHFDIVARYDEPIRALETLTAKRVLKTHSDDGATYTYDMGIAMAGVPSVTIPAGWLKEGDTVLFRFGEDIYPGNADSCNTNDYYTGLYGENGTYHANVAGRVLHDTYRAALATDFYIASKEDETREVTIQPHLTYRGYRYIQITLPSAGKALPLENVKGIVLSSVQEITGTYHATTTDETITAYLNQLFLNIQRSQIGNFMSIPTDCPQRNERMGWTGDAQAFCRTATYNADVQNFFRQWMVALRNDQADNGGIGTTVPTYSHTTDEPFDNSTTWAAAVCMVPWQLYTQYGDTGIIRENFETMKAWLEGMAKSPFEANGTVYTGLSGMTMGLADWLSLDGNTTPDIVNNAIYIYMLEVSAIMADAIGETAYAETLRARHARAKAEWNAVYIDPETGMTRSADGKRMDSQSSYATPLNFNCFSEENRAFAAKRLAELAADPNQSDGGAGVIEGFTFGGTGGGKLDCPAYSITTGFSGTPNLLPALTRNGQAETAYRMIACTEYASWLYPVTLGATTSWERWNSYELAFQDGGNSAMNSFNHFALGSVGSWMYEFQLGITTDHEAGKAGYQSFVLQPQAGSNYRALEGSYTSNYGVIESAWTAEEGVMTSYCATVPANTEAVLYLPVEEGVSEFGETEGAVYAGQETRNGILTAKYLLSSGKFRFEISKTGVTAS
ncbi:MAG: family 78 glycoside hydrolase catalytic domain [Eubacteriales bacterium]|nr:family 78 glycoside hydrolase catalytic domain [Eubacteriales bacterium]